MAYVNSESSRWSRRACMATMGLFLLVPAIAKAGEGSTGAPAPASLQDAMLVSTAEAKAREKLPDPASAQFPSAGVYRGSGAAAVCGMVEFKDRAGRHVGPVRFVVKEDVVAIEDPLTTAGMDKSWAQVCR